MASILDRIFAAKREEVNARQDVMPLAAMRAVAAAAEAPRDFLAALRAYQPAIIAEIKRASPSKGDILPGLDPATVARAYRDGGAAAISVLTDQHFKGSLDDLRAVRAAIHLPLLRKDFMFAPYQVYEARAAGADAILLIVAMLERKGLCELAALAHELGMAALVEVHNEAEFAQAVELDAEVIGINNRDLHTFKTDIAVTERLLHGYHGNGVIISESGIETAADIACLAEAGARGFLIGESLLRGGNPAHALSTLLAPVTSRAQ
ncbi:MAG: indole-3-glycerol phosphate synthase TrpC [Candidatus Binataceae bacterium]